MRDPSVAEPTKRRTEVAVRRARAGDPALIAAVHARSWRATYPHLPIAGRAVEEHEDWVNLWEARIGDPADTVTLVAVENDQVWGFVYVEPSPDPDDDAARVGQVWSIHVDPDRVGCGVGSRLIDAAVATLTEAGYRSASLWVVEGNDRARRFYEHKGWQADGTSRQELLAVAGEEGDEVRVVRYRISLGAVTKEGGQG